MNLAVFIPNWIGDAVMATPALRALRKHYPSARITGVLKPYVAGVLQGGAWLDETISADDNLASIAWQLRRRRIELAVLFTNSFRTALISRLAGCTRRI